MLGCIGKDYDRHVARSYPQPMKECKSWCNSNCNEDLSKVVMFHRMSNKYRNFLFEVVLVGG